MAQLNDAAVAARTSPDFLVTSARDPAGAVRDVPIEALFPAVRTMIRLGQFVEKKLVADVLTEVTAEQRRALTAAYLVGAAAVLILMLVVTAQRGGRTDGGPTADPAHPLGRPRRPGRRGRAGPGHRRRGGEPTSRSGWSRWTSGPTTRSATWRGPSTGCRAPPRGWSSGRSPADATWRRCSVTSAGAPRTWSAGRSPSSTGWSSRRPTRAGWSTCTGSTTSPAGCAATPAAWWCSPARPAPTRTPRRCRWPTSSGWRSARSRTTPGWTCGCRRASRPRRRWSVTSSWRWPS